MMKTKFGISLVAAVIGFTGIMLGYQNPFGFTFWLHVSIFFLGLGGVLALIGIAVWNISWWRRALSAFVIMLGAVILLSGFIMVTGAWIRFFAPVLTSTQWKEDLQSLRSFMATKHQGYSVSINDSAFSAYCTLMENKISSMQPYEVKCEYLKMIAQLNDGHSSIIPFQPAINFNFFPIEAYWFSDGLYVLRADDRLVNLAGSKIIAFNETPIEEVYNRVSAYMGVENEYNRRFRFPIYCFAAEILKHERIIDDMDVMQITVEKDGVNQSVTIHAQPFYKWGFWYFKPWKYNADNVAREIFLPFRKKFRVQVIHDSVLYFQWNAVNNDKGSTVRQLAEQIQATVERFEIQYLIIDVRNNPGGDNTLIGPLIRAIVSNNVINRPGHLFVLTGRATYSAAVNFLSQLQNQTEAIFVGEPSGQGPNMYGDNIAYRLPYSRIRVDISSRQWFGSLPEDMRNAIVPHYPVSVSYHDYENGIDRAMKVVDSLIQSNTAQVVRRDRPSDVQYFQFSPYQHARLEFHSDTTAEFYITDYSGVSLFDVKKFLCLKSPSFWKSDLYPIDISLMKDTLSINWFNVKHSAKRITKADSLPMQHIALGNYEKAKKLIKQDRSNIPPNTQSLLNTLGYSLLSQRQFEHALRVFQLNAELFPASANVFDSLGEAYLLKGDRQKAKIYYQKALEIKPDFESPRRALKLLQ